MKLDEFKTLRQNLKEGDSLILKFGAKWCKPCQRIKSFIADIVERLPDNVQFYEIDINESVELYLGFKSKKMIKGVPTILGFSGDSDNDIWYIPDDIVSSTDESIICDFFKNVV